MTIFKERLYKVFHEKNSVQRYLARRFLLGSTPWNRGSRAELNKKRVLRHPCWCLTSASKGRRMDPQQQFCHNERCRAYGRKGEGHIVIHSQKERRYRCKRCGRTFTETKGTALYRIHKPKWLVVAVVTLLAYGCPLQAIVAAFDLDERTVARWQREAALQCKRVHEHTVEAGRVRLLQVQADEIRVKAVGGIYWLASALEVRSRLWLGGVISHSRDRHLIRSLLIRVCSCGPVERILLVTDGLSSYASQALHVFREPLHTGRRWPSEAGIGQRDNGRPSHKAPRAPKGSGSPTACGRWGAEAEVISRVISNPAFDTSFDQHFLHRASERHLPGASGSFGTYAPEPERTSSARLSGGCGW